MEWTVIFAQYVLLTCCVLTRTEAGDDNSTQPRAAGYDLYMYSFGPESHYQKQVRPVSNYDTGLEVFIHLSLLSLVDVNEQSQTMQAMCKLTVEWTDMFLSWSPEYYANITTHLVTQDIVWLPDIVVANSVDPQHQLGYKHLPVRIDHDGLLQWTPTVNTQTSCDIETTYYPFDTQKCTIEFETAVSGSEEVYVYIDRDETTIDTNEYSEDGSWELISTKAANAGSDEWVGSKSKIIFTVLLERRNTFYIISIILPVFFLSFTASLVFALPADAGEKMGTGITVLLAYAVYLTIVSDYLPDTSLETSVLALYLTLLLGYTALAVVLSTFVLRLYHRDADAPVGERTQSVVRGLRCLMCQGGGEDADKYEPTEAHDSPPSHKRQQSPSRDHSYPVVHAQGGGPQQGGGPRVPRGGNQPWQFYHNRSYVEDISLDDLHNPRPKGRDTGAPKGQMTWQEVAATVDWFFFLLFTWVVVLTTAVVVFWLMYMSEKNKPEL